MIKSSLLRINLIFILIGLFIPNLVSAESKTFIKEYIFQAGDEDSKNSSRVIALREVKRLLLEELGTYLESETQVKKFQLTKDTITALTAGIVQTEIVEEKWDGYKYYLRAHITTDLADVIKSIDALRKDKEKSKELEKTRKWVDELLQENENLKKELSTKINNREEVKGRYTQNVNLLSAIEWFEKGKSFTFAGYYDGAIDAYSKTIELNPGYAEAYNNRGWTYVKLNKLSQAIKDYDKLIEIDPVVKTDFFYYKEDKKLMSFTASDYQNYSEAIEKSMVESVKLDSIGAISFVCRGLLYERFGNWQMAIKNYDEAIELEPNDENIYRRRGRSYRSRGKYEQAIKDYDKAIKLNPELVAAYIERGIIHMNSKNYKQAIEDYDKAIKLDPQNAWVYLARGFSYHSLGKDNKAIEEYKIASKLGNKASQDFLRNNGISW